MKLRKTFAVSAAAFLLLAGCSSDDDAAPADNGGSDSPLEDVKDGEAPDADDTPDASGGSGSGVQSATLEFDGETIELSGGGCVLEPQDAAGGGKILYNGWATGVNSDGEEVTLDVRRFDEDSLVDGDVIDLVIGDYKDPDVRDYDMGSMVGVEHLGKHFSVDGSTISADDVELTEKDMERHLVVSFEINC